MAKPRGRIKKIVFSLRGSENKPLIEKVKKSQPVYFKAYSITDRVG